MFFGSIGLHSVLYATAGDCNKNNTNKNSNTTYTKMRNRMHEDMNWKSNTGAMGEKLKYVQIRVTISEEEISWQSQWLLFATTNKRCTAFFSMFLQLPIYPKKASPSQKKNITELLHNRLQAIKYKKHVLLSQSWLFIFFREFSDEIH